MFAAAALLGVAFSAPVMADTVTFFTFNPDSDGTGGITPKEFVYNAVTGLTTGPGAQGSGGIFSPGMSGTITGGLPGITLSPPGDGPGAPYNSLVDLTLVLTGFNPDGAAITSASSIFQELTGGTFQILHPAFSKPLLAGTVDGALITLKKGPTTPGPGNNASVLSGNVVYTDSILEDSFAAAGLGLTGSFSFSMTGITGTYGTTLVGGLPQLSNFTADGGGQFDVNPAVVPAPAAVWSGIGLIGLLGAFRVKKRRDMAS
jgi:hypothetical protein